MVDGDVSMGAYVIVEGPVKLRSGTRIWPHAHLSGDTTIGRDCEVHMGAVIGHVPQDHHYEGGESRVVIGDRNVIREHATIHRGSRSQQEAWVQIAQLGDHPEIVTILEFLRSSKRGICWQKRGELTEETSSR
jgi:UDP-N-acetylglucosamine acyltransferase